MEDEIKERNRKRAEIWALKSFRDRSKATMEDLDELFSVNSDMKKMLGK